MNCKSCGSKLNGTENYCANCGARINNDIISIDDNLNRSIENKRVASLVLGIVSISLLFVGIFAPISLILAIIGLILAIIAGRKVKNTAGIILNAISLLLSLIVTLIIALIIIFSFNIIRDTWDNINTPSQSDNYGDF